MIRPFRLGDLYLIQRLTWQSTKFHTVQSLLQSYSVLRSALGSAIPLADAKVTTYVLRQDGHGLVHSGFLQVQKRSGAPAADVLCLAPGLDAPEGHPAIWTKLLSAYLHDAMAQGILRIYADVLDQPLPVSTFAGVGFQVYGRQTIWRLFTPTIESYAHLVTATLRLSGEADEWALGQLYARTVPDRVQQAEGWLMAEGSRAPIVTNWVAEHGPTYVLVENGEVCGAVQIAPGVHGSWLQWWTEPQRTDTHHVKQLLCHGLTVIRENGWRAPVYLAVADYHGGVAPFLADYGFAPFSDRVMLVKHVAKWVRENVVAPAAVLETTSEVVPSPFAPPKSVYRRGT